MSETKQLIKYLRNLTMNNTTQLNLRDNVASWKKGESNAKKADFIGN